jgi:hypothetical protein
LLLPLCAALVWPLLMALVAVGGGVQVNVNEGHGGGVLMPVDAFYGRFRVVLLLAPEFC